MNINNNLNIFFQTKKQSAAQIPPKYAPEGVKDAWQKAETSANFKYGSKSNITGRYVPEGTGYQDIYASPNFSYKQLNSTTESYAVNISETALELSRNADVGDISKKNNCEDLPIEAFALPKWFSKLIPDEAVLRDQVGLSLSNPGIQQSSNSSLSSDRIDELGEYVNKLLQYFQKELKNNGIEDGVDYHTSVLKNEETSEAIHQAVQNRIFDDLRTRELMQSFGKSL